MTVKFTGKTSWFGGPQDTGVAPDEGLAFLYKVEDAPHLFLPQQPPGTTGLARRLDPAVNYVACRWDYDNPETSKDALRVQMSALIVAHKTKKFLLAYPADWGPHEDTGRHSDISEGAMRTLGIQTDDTITVIFPAPALPKEHIEKHIARRAKEIAHGAKRKKRK
jgi:hypothetical protein